MTDNIIETPIEINEIQKILPHRHPMLLIDRVTNALVPQRQGVGLARKIGADLALANATSDTIRQRAVEDGLVTLKEAAIRKVIEGVTTVEEVLAIAAESG